MYVIKESTNLLTAFKQYFTSEDFGNRMQKEILFYEKNGIIIDDKKVKYNQIGNFQNCEENSYKYAKNNNLNVIIGYVCTDDNYWVNHYWVYDAKNNSHIEVTKGIANSYGRIGVIIKNEMLKIPLSKWGSFSINKMKEL